MRRMKQIFALGACVAGFGAVLLAQQPSAPQPPRSTASVNTQPRVDVLGMARPIDMHDTVWIEDLTMMEVRDLLKAGKTTALILTGGIEENGPYLTTGKHNNVLRVTGESIARALGDALVAPIVTLEPGNPERIRTPGSVFLSADTYRAVLTDMATSLKTQGFKNVFFLGDSGGNLKPMQEVADALNTKWKGDPSGAHAYHIAEYYNYDEVEKFEQETLGIHEKLEGLHDDYYITALIAVHDPNGIRMPERIKAGKFVINGVPLAPIEKTVENGRKIAAFRTEKAVAAIRKALASAKAAQ
jgi:creatinine amidohydrolase/Fe(II)-dependent formamide hydrolase-like protein